MVNDPFEREDWEGIQGELGVMTANLPGVLEDTAACGGTEQEYRAVQALEAAIAAQNIDALRIIASAGLCAPYTKALRAWLRAHDQRTQSQAAKVS